MEKVTMSGRLLPNKDYQKVITHDKIYAECLSQKLEFNFERIRWVIGDLKIEIRIEIFVII